MKIYPLILVLFLSCSHKIKKSDVAELPQNSPQACLMPLVDPPIKKDAQLSSIIRQGVGYPSSYLLTGIGFTTDIALYTGVITGAVMFCGQFSSADCFGGLVGMFDSSYNSLGKSAYEKTELWRCPYVDHISKALRQTTECLKTNNMDKEALEQLDLIRYDKILQTCSTEFEKEEVKKLVGSLEKFQK